MGQLEQTPHLKRYALKMELKKKKNGAKEKFMRKRIWAVTSRKPSPNPKRSIISLFQVSLSKLFEFFMCTCFAFILKEKLLSSGDKIKCTAHWDLPYSLWNLEVHTYLPISRSNVCSMTFWIPSRSMSLMEKNWIS